MALAVHCQLNPQVRLFVPTVMAPKLAYRRGKREGGEEPVSKHQIRSGDGRWEERRGVGWLNPRRETKTKGRNGDREKEMKEEVSESIETTLRTRRLLWAGTLLRMSGGRLPKRIAFGNLEGAVRRGRGGKEKEWTDCVQSDIRTFGIAGNWKAMALNAEVWVETVTEGGRRFMAAWRKEEVDAARHRQEKREATRLGTLLSQTGV